MHTERWQKICEQSKCKVVGKRPTADGNILLAERIVQDPADGTKVFETLWAVERDGADIAQVVRNPLFQEKHGIWRSTDTPTDQKDRIQEAVEAAMQFIRDNKRVGRYS